MVSVSIDYIKNLEPLWGKWYLSNQIGAGSVGAVFQIHTHDNETAALKHVHISFPETIKSLTPIDKEIYIHNAIEKIKRTYMLVHNLIDCPNVIHYDELSVYEFDQSADVLIRMELLEPLQNYILNHGMTERDVVKLGVDISSALVACHSNNLVHRDIKKENIFYHPNGYKLGDFDLVTNVNNMPDVPCGTLSTIAPEIYQGQPYDYRSDIYSLGITMYRLLNGGSLPFLSERENIKCPTPSEAIRRRMSGEPLPPPLYASKELAELILRACAYEVKQRPQSADEFHRKLSELLSITSEKYVITPKREKNIDAMHLQDCTLDRTVLDQGFLFQTEDYSKIDITVMLSNLKNPLSLNGKKSTSNQSRIPEVGQPNRDYGNNGGFPPSDNHDASSAQPSPRNNKYNFLSWFLFTCTISLIPLILYLFCGNFIIKGNVSHSIYIHEVVFFSIVILATALEDLCFGEGRKEHPIAALIIGGSAIIILIIVSGLFAMIIVSEVTPNAIELNNELLFPVSIGICILSVIMGAVVELMEDAL